MSRKVLFVLKLLVGAYLVFVGVTLLRTILEVQPGNQEIMSGISTVFIVVGAGYLIGVLGNAVKRSLEARAAEYEDELDEIPEGRPVRDRAMFRTAPMKLAEEDPRMHRDVEGTGQEMKPDIPAARVSSSTVTLQKVGPDTMVWENEKKEK